MHLKLMLLLQNHQRDVFSRSNPMPRHNGQWKAIAWKPLFVGLQGIADERGKSFFKEAIFPDIGLHAKGVYHLVAEGLKVVAEIPIEDCQLNFPITTIIFPGAFH